MSEVKLEYFVVYEREHFEPIKMFACVEKNNTKFQKLEKIKVRWAVDISDFDIEINKK